MPYIQTVQSAASADLKGFNNDVHGYIVFDKVNDQEFILSQRALLQANNDVHTLADSKQVSMLMMSGCFRCPLS